MPYGILVAYSCAERYTEGPVSEQTKVQIPLEMPVHQRDELDQIVSLTGESRMSIIRLACREYAERFFMRRRHIHEPSGTRETASEAA
jgi:hypothetical protein